MKCGDCGEEMERLAGEDFHLGYLHFCMGNHMAELRRLREIERAATKLLEVIDHYCNPKGPWGGYTEHLRTTLRHTEDK